MFILIAQVTGLSLRQLDFMDGGRGEDIGCVVCYNSADSDVANYSQPLRNPTLLPGLLRNDT